jgi:plasmid stability protein
MRVPLMRCHCGDALGLRPWGKMKTKEKEPSIDQKVQQKLLKIRTAKHGIVLSAEVLSKLEQALEEYLVTEKKLEEAKRLFKEAKSELERQDKQLRIALKDTKKVIKSQKKKLKKSEDRGSKDSN